MHKIQINLLTLVGLEDINKLTYREIAHKTGCNYASQVKHHLEQLKKKGKLITKADGSLIPLPSSPNAYAGVPILGEADCGEATLLATDEIQGYLKLSPSIMPQQRNGMNLYALKARGDSMNRANIKGKSIESGDYVLIQKTDPLIPHDGDYVVSVIQGLANIKKFHLDHEHDRIILLSESHQEFPPIIIAEEDLHHYNLTGKVIDVIKGVDG